MASTSFDGQHVPMVEEMPVDGSKISRTRDVSTRDFFFGEIKSKKIDTSSGEWRSMNKKQKEFYENQNDQIDAYEEADMLMDDRETGNVASRESNMKLERVAVYLSFGANICLLITLLVAVIFSGAISIIASVVDSSLDIFSGLIIVFTSIARRKFDYYKYPQGRERLEPVGVLVFSAVMGTTSLLLVIEAIQRLIDPNGHELEVGFLSLGLVVADVTVKFFLFLFCYSQRKKSLVAKALAQDHRNDIFVNSVALASSYLGSLYWPPLDPVGAILISCWTIYNWGSSCLEQVKVLTGRSASPEFLKRLTWICMKHCPDQVVAVDTVRAFHFGTRYLVEVDIVLPPSMALKDAHDIGEELQKKIEKFEEVERAFVHIDYETSHDPRSEHKQWGST